MNKLKKSISYINELVHESLGNNISDADKCIIDSLKDSIIAFSVSVGEELYPHDFDF